MKYALLAFLLLLAPPTPAQAPANVTVTATLKPTAPKVGDNALDLLVSDASGKPVPGLTLTARVAMTSMDMGTAKPAVKDLGGGHYAATVNLSMAGPWRVTLRAGAKTMGAFDMTAGAKTPAALPVLNVTLPSAASASATPSASVSEAAPPPVAASSAKPAPMSGMKMDGKKPMKMDGMKMDGMKMDEAKPGYGLAMNMADMTPLKMPQLKEKGVTTVTGQENWKVRTGFGRNAGMVAMMNQMMVEGTGMDKMKMDVMKMDFSAQNFTEDEDDKADGPAASMPGMKMDGMKMGGAGSGKAANGGKSADGMKNMDMPAVKPASPAALKITAALRAAPKVGDNALDITVLDGTGQPVAGASLTTRVEMTSMDMGTTKPAVKEMGGGKYAGTVKFSMAGPWRVTVKAMAPGQKPQTKSFEFTAK